ncbi:MAG: tetratricopeptide repeat protein [Myxococcales bacterium]|nr:tetratricopeptide repeat protein [Myxococcales bacterium]
MGRGASTIEELWEQAEEALEASSKRAAGLLTQLLSVADEGSEASLFAHRHLAELHLEDNPWKAALHLRRVLRHCAEDDILHALMGLCHALLGNYRVAVRSYREASSIAPQTPWYHHNLGHLMDVALDDPSGAYPHLRRAYELEPEHDEIIGSLAHCVARLGDLDEALKLAELAQEQGPCNPDHQGLVDWIEAGAVDTAGAKATVRRPPTDRVAETVQLKMGEAGYSRDEIERATQLWSDMQAHCELRVTKPEVLAAALEYAIAVVEQRPGCTQAEVARRYGVAPTSVSARFAQIRNALALRPGDPRYAASR